MHAIDQRAADSHQPGKFSGWAPWIFRGISAVLVVPAMLLAIIGTVQLHQPLRDGKDAYAVHIGPQNWLMATPRTTGTETRILRFKGSALPDFHTRDEAQQWLDNTWRKVDQPFTLTLQGDTAPIVVSPYPPLTEAQVWYLTGLNLLLLCFCFVVTAFVVWKSKDWFSIYAVTALMLYIPGNLWYTRTYFSTTALAEVNHVMDWLGWVLAAQVFFLFPSGRYRSAWSRVLAVFTPIMILWAEYGNAGPYSWVYQGDLFFLGLDIAIVWMMLHHIRRLTDAVQRQQVKWAVFGLSVGYLAYWFHHLPHHYLPGMQNPADQLTFELLTRPLYYIAMAIIPATFALSILKIRLWDADAVINRTVVYTALTGALVVMDSTLMQVVKVSFRNASFVQMLSTTAFTTLAFRPLLLKCQRLVDRRFFRSKVDLGQAVADFNSEVRSLVELPDVLRTIATHTATLMQSAHGAVYLRHGSGSFRLEKTHPTALKAPPLLEPSDHLIPRLMAGQPAAAASDPLFKLYLPLLDHNGGGRLLGLVALGPRRSAQGYSQDDLRLLMAMLNTAEESLEVALLVGQQRRYDAKLRDVMNFSLSLSAEATEDTLLHQVMSKAKLLSGARIAAIYRSDGRELRPACAWSDAPRTADGAGEPPPSLPLFDSATGEPQAHLSSCQAALTGQTVTDCLCSLTGEASPATRALAVPIKARAKVVAVIELADPCDPATGEPDPFTDAEVRAVEFLAAVAVLPLEDRRREKALEVEVDRLQHQLAVAGALSGQEYFHRFLDALDSFVEERARKIGARD